MDYEAKSLGNGTPGAKPISQRFLRKKQVSAGGPVTTMQLWSKIHLLLTTYMVMGTATIDRFFGAHHVGTRAR
jgi:hypothetical protein